MKSNGPLYANRRGIAPLHAAIDKPMITASELIRCRKIGLSYKQIGRKLGIDCHKEDVMQVYKALGTNIETVKGPSKVSPLTPLWYLFDSEKELIKDFMLPSQTDVKQLLPQNRILSCLGENAGFMLNIYLKVNKIMSEEILSAFGGASDSSSLGNLKKWDGDLASSVIAKVSDIQKSVGQAAYELSDYFELTEVGRCVCSATKALRFGWKDDLIPYPSFFWGCSKYTSFDASKHDKATPVRATFWKVVCDEIKVASISDKNLTKLKEKTALAITFWDGKNDDETELLSQASDYYGGPEEILPCKNIEHIIISLRGINRDLTACLAERGIELNH